MKIEIHVLQNFPPSNLNRDENGMPKSCVFGGRNRARISSQCQKRATRLYYHKYANLGDDVLACRSKNWADKIASLLKEEGIDEEKAESVAKRVISVFTTKDGKSKAKTNKKSEKQESIETEDKQESGKYDTGLFLGAVEIKSIVTHLQQNWQQVETDLQAKEQSLSEEIVNFIKKTVERSAKPGDVALFGRMMASLPSGNVDASVQVAHAIGVNALEQEFDFFTAVDDLSRSDKQGADHLGEKGYNSSTYYRFAVLDTKQLISNLGNPEGGPPIAHAFVEAFIKAIPSGHQNSFAAHTLPAFVLTIVRTGQPVSLVDAFENPIRPSGGMSLVEKAVEALDHHYKEITTIYGNKDVQFIGLVTRSELLAKVEALKQFEVEALKQPGEQSLETLLRETIEHAFQENGDK